jgi:hypothetical protein
MTRAAQSIFLFGIYLVVTGLILFAMPNMLLALLRLSPTTEPWIRVLGIPVGVMGATYVAAARANIFPFFRLTLWGRAIVPLGLGLLVVFRLAPPILIVFGLMDAAGALWTRAALRHGAARDQVRRATSA